MKKVLLVLLILIAAAAAFIATRPGTFHVERTATIAAPPPVVFANLDDFHQWPEWSPWEGRDPQMTREYEGAESGVGAAYHWKGNDEVGEGRMTITDAQPPARLAIRLDFIKPFAATSQTTFALAPEGDSTRVHWAMDGTNNFLSKAFSVFMDMDQVVGGDFEQGLAQLKTVSESEAAAVRDAEVPAFTDTSAVFE